MDEKGSSSFSRVKRGRAQASGSSSTSTSNNGSNAPNLDLTYEELAAMNPSLMTERQQLAFLLRQTAPAHPESSSESLSSDDEDEDEEDVSTSDSAAEELQRPTKHRKKSKKKSDLKRKTFKLQLMCRVSSLSNDDENEEGRKILTKSVVERQRKKLKRGYHSAESSLSAPLRRGSGSSFDHGCAVCGQTNSPETLFLCKKCDFKYPTQRMLGRA